MSTTDLYHFQRLKQAVQEEYLRHHSPTHEDISSWKGVDIMYFLEDLRIRTRGNISEKTFYTYFKAKEQVKIPRIDTLNMLCMYAGYKSWSQFKKANEEKVKDSPIDEEFHSKQTSLEPENLSLKENHLDTSSEELIQDTIPRIAREQLDPAAPLSALEKNKTQFSKRKLYFLYILSGILVCVGMGYSFWEYVWKTEYTYCFIDADRNIRIPNNLSIQVIKENESPIHYRLKAGECFTYQTHSEKRITMKVSSPYYETAEIIRNLEEAPINETIILKPNNNAIMLHYYSHSITNLKKKREQLNRLISDNALIYQVFDNDYYGVETLTKQKYINLMTLPSSSLAGLNVIDTQIKNGKLVMIKFRVNNEEKK